MSDLQCKFYENCKKVDVQKQIDKYYKALQEIRAIAIHEIKELTDSAINGGRYLEIIDKINEVIGAEE